MERVLAVRRAVIAASIALAAASCSSGQGGNKAIFQAALKELWPGGDKEEQAAPQPAPQLTRAAVEASGAAMIQGRLEAEAVRSLQTALAQNGEYVTYISQFQQSLTLRGTLVTASRGFGFDLLSVTAQPDDPLVRSRPLTEWPTQISRTYRFPGPGPEGITRTVTCRYRPGETMSVDIVEITYDGLQVEEICEGDGLSFTNDLFVENGSGFVWRSFQWLGPQQGRIDLEIIEPVDG